MCRRENSGDVPPGLPGGGRHGLQARNVESVISERHHDRSGRPSIVIFDLDQYVHGNLVQTDVPSKRQRKAFEI
jgi:hypothetical protein